MIITYDEPGILYDDPRVTYDGVFTDASVWPAESTVSLGVQYGPNGVDFTGSAIAGNGAQIIAYRSDVQVSTPTLRITSRPKRQVQPQQEQEPAMLRNKATGNIYAFSDTTGAGLSVIMQRSEPLSVVASQRRSDVFTSIADRLDAFTDATYVTTTTATTSV